MAYKPIQPNRLHMAGLGWFKLPARRRRAQGWFGCCSAGTGPWTFGILRDGGVGLLLMRMVT